jgi:hypothetical protein
MSSKKTTTTFKSSLSKLGGGSVSGVKRENLLQGFTPSSPINFGKPSDRKALVSSAGTAMDWGGLAKQVVSGGAASLFNTSASAAFGGLGSLISGITSLFGGGEKKAPPALQLFQLPDAVNQTVHLQGGSSAGSAGSSGSAVHVHVQAMDTQSFLNRSNDIARAVKTAMLNSHSLNDVVSEL